MAMYPERLMPETVEDLHPPSGLNVLVPKVRALASASPSPLVPQEIEGRAGLLRCERYGRTFR
jgi:hypothetical protein